MDYIVNKLKLVYLKKLLRQFEKAQKLIGGSFDVDKLNPELKEMYLSDNPPDIQKTLDFVNKWEDQLLEFTKKLATNTEKVRDSIYVNNEKLKEMEYNFNKLDEAIDIQTGGVNLDLNEEYDFINSNILKLDKLMKKYMDYDILEIRNKLVSINNSDSDSDSDSLYEFDSDSIDDTFYKFNMMKNMENKKNNFPLDRIQNSGKNTETNYETKYETNYETIINEKNVDWKNNFFLLLDRMNDHIY
tara:strand:- start:3740 stop:4471 length:732 start_codon:yes stop_codon:yes gene_type:complete